MPAAAAKLCKASPASRSTQLRPCPPSRPSQSPWDHQKASAPRESISGSVSAFPGRHTQEKERKQHLSRSTRLRVTRQRADPAEVAVGTHALSGGARRDAMAVPKGHRRLVLCRRVRPRVACSRRRSACRRRPGAGGGPAAQQAAARACTAARYGAVSPLGSKQECQHFRWAGPLATCPPADDDGCRLHCHAPPQRAHRLQLLPWRRSH